MKNVIFWVGVKNQTYSEKYGGWDWMDISRKTWEYWCKKHDVIFFPFEKPINDDLVNYRINWQKSIYCFDLLDEVGIDKTTGKTVIRCSDKYYRPAEVETLLGDARKAREELGWEPKISFDELIEDMCIYGQ